MIIKTIKPLGMDNINSVYYPLGLPAKDDPNEIFHFTKYLDQDENVYAICYTKKQVLDLRESHPMASFCPYIPLHVTP